MKLPLDNDLNKAYEAFNQKHDQLRDKLMASLPDFQNWARILVVQTIFLYLFEEPSQEIE